MTANLSAADQEIADTAAQLKRLKSALGHEYWRSEEVVELRESLRRLIGNYGAWGADRLPMHQRARAAARYERELAYLLWPGAVDPSDP